ncbi:MAG: cation-translocating P-type ATPase [Anaerolineae bacterium]|nr:cation-translocating P-type ATPase [Anaerolineae bacterium]
MSTPPWHSLPYEQALTDLESDPEKGLSADEAQARLEKYGRNELREQPRPGFLTRLLNQFKSLVIILLIVAAIISAFFGDWPEAGAIILIVVLNAALGVVQEGKAEEALAALKKMSAPEAHLLRDGHVVTVPSGEVVPGDIVLLEAGNYVPADLRLIEAVNLQIDEASMTGESVPVSKDASRKVADDAVLGDRKTMAHKSTIATYGRGKGVVIATGMQTEIGKIAEMIQSVEEELTPLQRRLDQLGAVLVYAALAICGVVFLVAFAQAAVRAAEHINVTTLMDFFGALDNPALREELIAAGVEAFETAVALAVAAVPEGLPAIVTINLALGMREMVKRNALIRRLPAVETLGSASAICSDKTGTLTQNEMTAVRLYVPDLFVDVSGEGYAPEGQFHQSGDKVVPEEMPDLVHLLTGALLSSDARLEALSSGEGTSGNGREFRIAGDPTEGALVVAAAKANLTRERMGELYPRRDEIPFDSARKRMSTLHNDPDSTRLILFVKGAPDLVLELCTHVYDKGEAQPLTEEMRTHIANVNRDMAQAALRVLAVAERRFDKPPVELSSEEHERDLTFIGLVGMIDPARPEVKPAIERARQAGIKTVMVTGDYPDTARAIAQEIGLLREGGRVVTGAELQKTDDDALAGMLTDIDVFARVSPEHKVRIVDAFRKRDYVVAMTGDGVNDAPALKRASIGVAMGITGTDVSKETADMVLTDDNYVSIVNAVEQGRIIYDNIRKFVFFLISCNTAEIAVIFIGTLLGYPTILSAIQLLWLNLLTDGAPALALGVEKGDPNIMDRPPRPQNEPIVNRVMLIGTIVQTVFKTAVTLAGFFLGLSQGGLAEGRSVAFAVLAFSELLRAYTARSEYFSIFRIGPFSNKWMQYAVLVSVVLLLIVIYVPFLNPIFDTQPLSLVDWAEIVPLCLLPAVAAEVTKIFLRAEQNKKAVMAGAGGVVA